MQPVRVFSIAEKAEVKTLNSDAAITTSGSGAPKVITGDGTVTTKTSEAASESAGGGGGGGGGGGSTDEEVVTSDTTSPIVTAGIANRASGTAATVKFTSNEPGRYYYAIVNHSATEPTVDTSVVGATCTTAETTIDLTLDAAAKDVYIKVKDAAGNVSTAIKIEVPEYVAAQYGLVKAYIAANEIDNAKVKLLKADGSVTTYYLADNLEPNIGIGQMTAYVISDAATIGTIDLVNEATYVISGLTIQNAMALTMNSATRDISDDVVVFTYKNGTTPGAVGCSYSITDIDYLTYNHSISSPASVYLNSEGDAVALLIPESEVAAAKPADPDGIAPTSAANNDGKLTGVNSTMEYKRSTETGYIAIAGTEVTGLVPGMYDVRYAASRRNCGRSSCNG